MSTILDEVRSGAARVAERAEWVHIDPDALRSWAAALSAEELDAALAEPPLASSAGSAAATADQIEHTIALVLALDTTNFGSGWHPVVTKRPGCSGAVTMATALREFAAEHPITADWLTGVDAAACHDVFGQPVGGPVDELMSHFAAALNELGRLVARRYEARFTALVADARGSAAALVELLATSLPYFADIASHHGEQVPILKRAQIAAIDLARTFGGDGPGRLTGLDQLTIFADNLVPHVLRLDGVLRFHPALVERIETEQLLDPGEPAEVEIRAVAIHAVERIVAELADRGLHTTPADLDLLLWLRGGSPSYKAHPRHRCRCIWY